MLYAHENVQLGTIADITPGGTPTPLIASGGDDIVATWVKVTATGSTCRIGDANVGSARGSLLEAGVPYTLERGDFDQQGYPLKQVYVYASGGDKVSITYAV